MIWHLIIHGPVSCPGINSLIGCKRCGFCSQRDLGLKLVPPAPGCLNFDSEPQNLHLCLEFKILSPGKELRRWENGCKSAQHCVAHNRNSLNTTALLEGEEHSLLPFPQSHGSQPWLHIGVCCIALHARRSWDGASIYSFKAPLATSLEQTAQYWVQQMFKKDLINRLRCRVRRSI